MYKAAVLIALAATLGVVLGRGYQSSGYGTYQTHYNHEYYGHWGYWSEWSDCSVTCGGGTQSRSRECQKPHYGYGEYKGCEGDDSEERECNTDGCPVDGGWAEWGEYSDCSVDCGGGTKSRSRTCTNPEPANGGKDCEGDDSETSSCNDHKCPVDGGWGDWGYWSSCSATCGKASRTRSRSCDYPEPAYGGADCEGDSSESEYCYVPKCYQSYSHGSHGGYGSHGRSSSHGGYSGHSGYNGHRGGYSGYNGHRGGYKSSYSQYYN